MKTLSLKKTKVIGLLASVLLVGLTACNKSGGGGGSSTPAPVTPNYIGGCSGCQGISVNAPLLVGVRAATPDDQILMTLDVLGQNVSGSQFPKAIVTYGGPGVIIGTIRVLSSSIPAVCNLAQGDYSIQPIQPSTLAMGVIAGGRYQAVAPQGRIVFSLSSSSFYNNDGGGIRYDSDENRVGLNMMVESINGQPCGLGILNTY